jgi:hypothetical protein
MPMPRASGDTTAPGDDSTRPSISMVPLSGTM